MDVSGISAPQNIRTELSVSTPTGSSSPRQRAAADVAIGSGGDADQTGALQAIASTTGGNAASLAAAVALVPLTLWRLAETILGLHPGERHDPDPSGGLLERFQ
jgi:hypothetical protein